MYAHGNPKTKKELKAWIADGRKVEAFQPGGFFPGKTDGDVTIEGPHFPKPHRWYARATLRGGVITKILS